MSDYLKGSLQAIANEVCQVDLHDRVLKGSRRQTIRQRLVIAAVAVVAGGVAFGASLLLPEPRRSVGPLESPTPTASSSPSPSASPDAAASVDIRNATLALPSFPGVAACPAATRKFVDGRVAVGTENIEMVMTGVPVLADIDGEEGSEILVDFNCVDDVFFGQVLAVKVSPSGVLSVLGFVLQSPDGSYFERDSHEAIVVRDGVIEVPLLSPVVFGGGHHILDLQVRGYRYQAGAFRQVSGPTSFVPAATDPAKIDVRNASAEVIHPRFRDYVKFVDGKGQARMSPGGPIYTVTVVRSEFLRDPDSWIILYRVEDAAGVVSESITVCEPAGGVLADHCNRALDSSQDGIAHIEDFDAIGHAEGVKVTVTLPGGGGDVRTYRRPAEGGPGWARVS